ncbi:preprotein translocase subunit SecG [Tissierella sp.]|uniref:preprotein translocase subunit SecG n=1 Tax=Tissierella sp. TaxID=41274 RepID=UPI0028543019|nr:preprotein translocase subunit SecG [Tissierella sp.]MDR7855733.1 preprotein translocase subunit SecG [Tissierella sp.]
MTTLFSVLILASSLSLIVSVVLQEGNDGGLGTVGGNSSDSLWGKSRGSSRQDMLKRVTVISAVIFLISALILAAK